MILFDYKFVKPLSYKVNFKPFKYNLNILKQPSYDYKIVVYNPNNYDIKDAVIEIELPFEIQNKYPNIVIGEANGKTIYARFSFLNADGNAYQDVSKWDGYGIALHIPYIQADSYYYAYIRLEDIPKALSPTYVYKYYTGGKLESGEYWTWGWSGEKRGSAGFSENELLTMYASPGVPRSSVWAKMFTQYIIDDSITILTKQCSYLPINTNNGYWHFGFNGLRFGGYAESGYYNYFLIIDGSSYKFGSPINNFYCYGKGMYEYWKIDIDVYRKTLSWISVDYNNNVRLNITKTFNRVDGNLTFYITSSSGYFVYEVTVINVYFDWMKIIGKYDKPLRVMIE